MKATNDVYRIIPVRFNSRDLKRLQKRAGAVRLSIAAMVRMMVVQQLDATGTNEVQ